MMSQVLHQGIGVSPGAVAGPVVWLAPPPPDTASGGTIENPALEAERAVAALADVASLLRARGAGPAQERDGEGDGTARNDRAQLEKLFLSLA